MPWIVWPVLLKFSGEWPGVIKTWSRTGAWSFAYRYQCRHVMKDGGDIYGTGVNVAVRLEGLADPGGILISEHAYQQVHDKLEIDLRDRGPQTLKNIDEPVRAYAIYIDTAQSAPSDAPKPKSPPRWRAAAAAIVIAGLVGALAWQSSRPPTVETAVVADMAYPLPDKPSIAVLPFEDLSFVQNGEAACRANERRYSDCSVQAFPTVCYLRQFEQNGEALVQRE